MARSLIRGLVNGTLPDLKAATDDAAPYGAATVLHVAQTNPEIRRMEKYRRTQELIRATFLIELLTMDSRRL